MKEVKRSELVVDEHYWDTDSKRSGEELIFKGRDKEGDYLFLSVESNTFYDKNKDGFIDFSANCDSPFYLDEE